MRLTILSAVLLGLVGVGCGDDERSAEGQAGSTTTEAVTSCDHRMIVFFDPAISDEEIQRAEPSIKALDGVVKTEVVTHAETFAEFQEIFSDNRQLIESVTPEILPGAIRVQVDEVSALDGVERFSTSLPDVHEVVRADEILSPAIEAQMGPDPLERWCSEDF